jgi:hypothetical protein
MDYRTAVTKEAKLAEIMAASTVAELDAMWSAWEAAGWSRTGQLYADVLRRKAELGERSDIDSMIIQRAERARSEGQSLPPIRGQFRG